MGESVFGEGDRASPGRSRRQTKASVRIADGVARSVITFGGVAVLAAMLGICVFLFQAAAPLFGSGSVERPAVAEMTSPTAGARTVVELYNNESSMVVLDGGRLVLVDLRTGREVSSRALVPEGVVVSTTALSAGHDRVAIGTDAGVLVAELQTWAVPVSASALPERLRLAFPGEIAGLTSEERASLGSVLRLRQEMSPLVHVIRSAEGPLLIRDVEVSVSSPIEVSGEGAFAWLSLGEAGNSRLALAYGREGGAAGVVTGRRSRRLGGRASSWRTSDVPFDTALIGRAAGSVFVIDEGDGVVSVSGDGTLTRLVRADGGFVAADRWRAIAGENAVSASALALGGQSLLLGTDGGRVVAVTLVDRPTAQTPDQREFDVAADMRAGASAVRTMWPSTRDRTLAVGLEGGEVAVLDTTSRKRALVVDAPSGESIGGVAMSPGADRLLVTDPGGYRLFAIDLGHSEASWASLFGRIQYEGYSEPRFVYQSTGAAEAEPKYSLVPLIWGTLKATVVAMLFAVPIAVLAALFTSEFLKPGTRRMIKPSIELMASLPSVVLGFIAAVAVAPYVRDWLPVIVIALGVVPVTVVIGAQLWRLVPARIVRRVGPTRQLVVITLAGLVGVGIAMVSGPIVERVAFGPTQHDLRVMAGSVEPVPRSAWPEWIGAREVLPIEDQRRLRERGLAFVGGEVVRPVPAPAAVASLTEDQRAGSIRRWLDGDYGDATPGWFFVFVGPALLVLVAMDRRVLGRWWEDVVENRSRRAGALVEIGRFVATLALAVVGALAIGVGLDAAGIDPRDSIFGPFSQRNTLVVGLVMGFAVIPIIYTISEDALHSVPRSLRSASLGAGATPWQTAVRVVLPVAGSGIFSACMIGLGRAVGETMIVLMATGNTPDISANIFSGFRTLAANIAVELPEAPRGGTHYRVLFLCGLVLFMMTLLINTSAEYVRQRFRKKSAAL